MPYSIHYALRLDETVLDAPAAYQLLPFVGFVVVDDDIDGGDRNTDDDDNDLNMVPLSRGFLHVCASSNHVRREPR